MGDATSRQTTPLKRYRWDSPEYAAAFATLLRCYGSRDHLYAVLRDLIDRYPSDATAIDWGAGSGDLTRFLLDRFQSVYAVEPAADMRTVLAKNCPRAHVIAGTIMTAQPPCQAAVGVISHVFYHVPDHQWGAHAIRAADFLTPDGTLLIVLKDADTGCNRMIEHLGAPRFDLIGRLEGVLRRQREFDFTFSRSRHEFRMTSLEDTLTVARFMLADREPEAFARAPTEEDFQEYVRTHLWNEEKQVGGWTVGDVYCTIRRNPRWPTSQAAIA